MFNENWYPENQLHELTALVDRAKHLKGDIMEIGCWEGKSTASIANRCFPDVLICNDTWLGNVQESVVTGNEHISETIAKTRDVYSIFIHNMDTLTKQNYQVVKRDCIDWLKSYDGHIKFIHIDASHEYESVFETIQLALPKMVKGGIMCGDDFHNANMGRHDLHGGVERAVREALPGFHNISNLWYYIQE